MQSNRSAKRANGRPRADPSQGLPRRVYLRHSAFYYVHHDGRWERLGKDLAEAKKLAAALNSDLPLTGTMNAWFDEWTKELDARVKADQLAPRTREDYVDALDFLRPFFGSTSDTCPFASEPDPMPRKCLSGLVKTAHQPVNF